MTFEEFASDPFQTAWKMKMDAQRFQYEPLSAAYWSWLLTYDAWATIMLRADWSGAVDLNGVGKRLLGLPVRVTVEDRVGVDPIQLVCDGNHVQISGRVSRPF